MKVILWLKDKLYPLTYKNVIETYAKGGLYCVLLENKKMIGYPVHDISHVEEDHSDDV